MENIQCNLMHNFILMFEFILDQCPFYPNTQRFVPGREALNFFSGYVLHGFPKVGSRERVFFEKLGVWERKFRNFAS